MSKTKNQTKIESCLNCFHPIQKEDSYCSQCGQKAIGSRISVWRILADFFSNVFNIDSKFFKSLRFVFIPARLPKEYMDGKRRSYVNPARFFFVTLVIHFAILAYAIKDQDITFYDDDLEQIETDNIKRVERVTLANTFDSLALLYPIENHANLDSIKNHLFRDTIRPDFSYVSFSEGNTYSNYDILTMDFDEIVEKYEVKDFWEKFQLEQMHKLRKDPKAAFQFVLGNALWVILLTTIASALFLKLLYIRRRFYVVDHLVVSMHYHSIILIILSLIYIPFFIFWDQEGLTILYGLLGSLIPLFGYLSLKKYYKQGYFKTLIKFGLLGFFEMLMLTVFVSIVALVSVALF